MAIPSRLLDQRLVLSKLKQGAYGTALTDVNLQAGKRFSPVGQFFGQTTSKFYTNRNQSMRGNDFASVRQETERDFQEQINFDADTWLLAWIAAFGMGAVTSSQPNAGGNPTCYQHLIKPLDPSSAGKDMPVTTVYTEAAQSANLQRRLLDCAVRDFTLDFKPSAPVNVTATLQGSGRVTTGALATPPAIPTQNLLMSNDMKVFYGTQGAPTDISAQIVPGSVKFSFTWSPDDGNSRSPGSGLYRSRSWVGQPALSMDFQRYVDDAASTPNDDWLAGTIQEVKLSIAGAQIGAGPETHLLEVRGLAVCPEVIKLGQAGDKTVYQYTISAEHWLKQGGNDVVTVKVNNLETSYFA
jgi:hypothetical protein